MVPEPPFITSQTKIVTVCGADSYFGAHLVKYLDHTDQMAYGFSQIKNLNFDEESMPVQEREKITFESVPTDTRLDCCRSGS